MKRLFALLCALVICFSLGACNPNEGGGSQEPGNTSPTPDAGKTEPGTPEKITILYPGDESERMTSFLNGEFKDRMLADLNMEVEVIFVPWDQYWDKKDIMLAANEPIDLFWDGLPDLGVMVNKKQAQPLNDLIAEYGQDMLKALPMDHIEGGAVDGTIYGIPSAYAPSSAMFQLVCVRQDILEDVGMTEITTPEDLMEYSKRAVDMYPHILGGAEPLIKPLTRYFTDEQYYFVSLSDFVVFGEETKTAQSFYETKAFQELSKFNLEMSKLGLYTDDVTLKYNERDSRVQTGNYIWVEGSLGKDTEIVDAVRANAPEAVMKSYLLAPEKPRYITAAGGEVICIPYSAPNPSGAMKWLNWLYSSLDNYNFALYGVEGVDYEIQGDRIQRLISDELFYEWMFRNQNYQMFSPEADAEFIETYKSWDDDAIYSAAFGFAFDNSNVQEIELRLIEAEKLFSPIRSGFVDFETEYPKAIAALKEAGIDEYVAEFQRQLDEYMAG